ncbi:MAG: ABC transporter ATP-binding protein [Hyphomicrobiales bacterium]|nr:ABC transporter ATP-binding protein [Hyphomicrobiales bacterium]
MLPLVLDDLVAGYGAAPVLNGLTLEIGARERVGLFGPNGHGKTTLLRAISGLIAPSRGSIRLFDKPISGMSPAAIVAEGLIHVPQSNLLFPEMEVLETLRLAAHSARARQTTAASLEGVLTLFPRLAERRSQKIKTLSGGERQMVAIGVGLMGAPRLLALDEPTLGLSPKLKDELCVAIGDIAKSGLPLLLVEQDVEFLLELTDRLVMVTHGRCGVELDARQGIDHATIMALYFGEGHAA